MDICQLVWRNLLPNEQTGRWTFRSFLQSPAQMGLLFEYFVRNFYKHHSSVTGFEVTRKNVYWQWKPMDKESEGPLPQMETDIALSNASRKILFECKFRLMTATNQCGSSRLKRDNLFQLNAYLTHLPHTVEDDRWDAVLLYPASSVSLRGRFRHGNRRIHVRTIDLNKKWNLIHQELLGLPADLEALSEAGSA